jgi:hypothetical protein
MWKETVFDQFNVLSCIRLEGFMKTTGVYSQSPLLDLNLELQNTSAAALSQLSVPKHW